MEMVDLAIEIALNQTEWNQRVHVAGSKILE